MDSPGSMPHHAVRAMKNDPRMEANVMEQATAAVGPAVPVSGGPNAAYGLADFHRIMMAACVLCVSAFGYAAAVRRIMTGRLNLKGNHRTSPSGEWVRSMIAGLDGNLLAGSFSRRISGQLADLRRLGALRGRMDVALDMHLMPRWDSKKGEDLARSKKKGGTTYFERYVTVQCIKAGTQVVTAAVRMGALEDTADFVTRTIAMCRSGGAEIRNVLLDREFFSTDVIRALDEAGVGYLMPCTNTSGVVGAIRKFARGERPAVSDHFIKKSNGETAPFTMIITKRKRRRRKKGGLHPENTYIAFATNRPDIDVETYGRRWMVETGYRMIENQRVRTRSRKVAARTLCFLYSLLVYNLWVISNAAATGSRVYPRVTQTDMMLAVLIEMLPWERILGIPPDGRCACGGAPAGAPHVRPHSTTRAPAGP